MNPLLTLAAYFLSGLMLGIVAFITFPLLAGSTRFGDKVGYRYVLLAFATVRRPIIRLGESLDLSFSKATTDSDWKAEKPNGADDTAYEDANMWHRLWNYPLAFADDVHGLLFDVRTAAAGERIHEARERGDLEIREGDERYCRSFFEFDRTGRELVDLGKIRTAVNGGADAGQPDRKEENYRKSQAKRGSESSSLKLLYPLAGFALGFGLVWALITQVGGGSSTRSVSVGVLAVLLSTSDGRLGELYAAGREWLSAHSTRVTAAAYGGSLLVVAVLVAITAFVVLGPVVTVVMAVGFGLGVAFLPVFAWALGPLLGGFGVLLASAFLMLGFWAYDRPVFDQVDEQRYELVEASDLGVDDVDDRTQWFRLAKSWVGFTFDPEACWSDATVDPSALDQQGLVTDGSGDTTTPRNYVPSVAYSRANGQWDGYVPESPDDSTVYVLSYRAAGLLREIATGRVGERAHRHAKKLYGGGDFDDNDTLILLTTAALTVLGAAMSFIMFGG